MKNHNGQFAGIAPDAREIEVLSKAAQDGWLTIYPGIRDAVIQSWRQACAGTDRAFAVARPEANRTTAWVVVPWPREWRATEQDLIRETLAGTAAIVTPNSVRAFLPFGCEAALMRQLLKLAALARDPDSSPFQVA